MQSIVICQLSSSVTILETLKLLSPDFPGFEYSSHSTNDNISFGYGRCFLFASSIYMERAWKYELKSVKFNLAF